MPLSDDDIMVRDGDDYTNSVYAPKKPTQRVEAEQEFNAILQTSKLILPDVSHWFEAQIIAADSLSNVKIDDMTVNGVSYSRTVSVEAQVLAQQLLKQALQAKHNEFKRFAEGLDNA
jgi:hypothetical protein